MKSRSNSSNKAEKKMFEIRTDIKINCSSMEMRSDLSSQRLSYNSTEKK